MSRLWILGASDPEMAAIERLLSGAGEQVARAVAHTGERCHPGNAYYACVPAECSALYEEILSQGGTLYLVECEPAGDRLGSQDPQMTDCAGMVVRIDHHRRGDPGYGVPPAEFLRGSSAGQVVSELARLGLVGHASEQRPIRWDWDSLSGKIDALPGAMGYATDVHWWYIQASPPSPATGDVGSACWIPTDLVYTAAADHCLGAAYRGECPGVDPDALMRWRAETRAEFQGRSVDDVLADIAAAQEVLRTCPMILLAGGKGAFVRDMRAAGHVPELPEAAARLGAAFVAQGLPHPSDGRVEIVLQCARPAHLAAWPEWAAANGIVDLYGGDPARGFAGGYLAAGEGGAR